MFITATLPDKDLAAVIKKNGLALPYYPELGILIVKRTQRKVSMDQPGFTTVSQEDSVISDLSYFCTLTMHFLY